MGVRLYNPESGRFLTTDPVYGGNRGTAGWRSIRYVGDVQPRGWTDDEVVRGG